MKHAKNYCFNMFTMKATILDTHGRSIIIRWVMSQEYPTNMNIMDNDHCFGISVYFVDKKAKFSEN